MKINKKDKLLSVLTKRHGENIHNNNIKNENGVIMTEMEKIQRIIRSLFKNCTTQVGKSERNRQFPLCKPLKTLNQLQISTLKRPITLK